MNLTTPARSEARLRRVTRALATLPSDIDDTELARIEDFLAIAVQACAQMRNGMEVRA